MTSQEPAPRPVVAESANPAPPKTPASEALSAATSLNGEQQPGNLLVASVDNMSESSEDVIMKDKLLPKVKQVSKCSYCQTNSAESLKTVPCLECGSRCHIDCMESTARFKDKILLGDDFFHFKCSRCTEGHEKFKRYHLSWVDVVHITLFNLTHNQNIRAGGSHDPTGQFSSNEHGPQEYRDSRTYFHYKADVARFIDKHWGYFWTKSRGETWINSASSALSTNSTENVPEDGRFESGKAKYNKNGMWALTDDLRFPSSYDSPQQQKTRTIMYSFADDGSLIELRTQAANGRRKRRTEPSVPKVTSRAKKPRASDAQAYGAATAGATFTMTKRGARGKQEPKNDWAIPMWPDIDNPQGPAHISREQTHSAPQFVIGSDRLTVWNDKAYRMAKASHGVESGAWYFEADILEPVRPEFNVRIGWSQISGELQAPCGYDVFSYSMRAKPSTRFHAARGSFYGEDYGPGDTLGVLLYLPQLDDDEKQDLAIRRLQPGDRYFQATYSRPAIQRPPYANSELPPMPVLAGSELVFFKNGKCLGPAFQKLYLGKYYPAISAYMGGKVNVNLGPTFKFPPPATWHDDTPVRPITDLEYTLPEKTEESAKTEEPTKTEEPAKAEEPVKAEETVTASAAAKTEMGAQPTAATTDIAAAPVEKKEDDVPLPVSDQQPATELPTAHISPEKEAPKTDPEPSAENDVPPVANDTQDIVMESVEANPSADQEAPGAADAIKADVAVNSTQHSATPPVSQMEAATIASENDTSTA